MKRVILPVLFLLLACLTGIVTAQTPEPTQTPYIIYVVITATPEPEVLQNMPEDTTILRPTAAETISLQNEQTGTAVQDTGGEVTIVNDTTTYATTVDELIQRVVSTVAAGSSSTTTADGTQDYSGTGGALVHLADGSTCTMNFALIS